MKSDLSIALLPFLTHTLAVVGARGGDWDNRVRIRLQPGALEQADRAHMLAGGLVFAVRPGRAFCESLGVSVCATVQGRCDFPAPEGISGSCLRSLHASDRYRGSGEAVLNDGTGRTVWRFVPQQGGGGALLAGSDLAADLLVYRQGDPALAEQRPQEAMWGIAGERPIYLFERQIEGLNRRDQRQADFWAVWAARMVASRAGVELAPILPDGAPGAVVITGDDDQAFLEKYEEQLQLLAGEPITYFLHPQTRHTSKTMRRMFSRSRVELGLHPDGLDAPNEYGRLFREQCAWFQRLVGNQPSSLRNHGYLNDGYWGHLSSWLEQGVRISSNLPGLDGQPLNGSYLPGRLFVDGRLTDHWSVVTAIGDGVRYVNGGRSDEDSAQIVLECADQIRGSGIPGLLVINLHPQNVADTRAMHQAAVDVIRSGFLAWTMQDCLDWFSGDKLAAERSWSMVEVAKGALSNAWRRAWGTAQP